MALNIPALIAAILFYLLTFTIGVWAAWKTKKDGKNSNQIELAIVANRKMNLFILLFSTTATWIGGAYINGTAEITYLPKGGLAWAQAPVGFFIGLLIGAIFFIKPMRSKNYMTMMDPLQEAYGNTMANFLFLISLIGDVFWFAAILASLGATVSVILDIQSYLAIIVSAFTVVIYTLLGGMYSVAYTDVIQLILLIFGLWMSVPFAMMNSASKSIANTVIREVYQAPWIGKIEMDYLGKWLDEILYLSLGSIPWQIYFQRVLSASSTTQARIATSVGAFGCFFMAVPSVLFGAVAASTDWNQTSYGLPSPFERGEAGMVLPIVLHYLCPTYVSVIGLGAIAAATMSSADSCLLSASSMFAHNIYKKILRKKASAKEVLLTMRLSMVLFGSAAAGLAFLSHSVYDLWFLSGELVYTILFPQICCVFYISNTNTYGSATGFLFGLLLRLLGGETSLKLPPVIHYPGCRLVDGVYVQLFPFKTFTMLVSLAIIVAVSYLSTFLFMHSIIPIHWDICNVMKGKTSTISLPRSEEVELQLNPLHGRGNESEN
ncbi:high affinity choline transporter 1-like [Rhinatrema bivittatum]|uniref:high affinity choline transporter 1-like n=1 Tax=Rhinatrema bivittatum TaxID=194408 RepID=UPI00112BBD69|nr:high affinity choline transporter 1-like [Rhinatrema bivittatum]